jgi:dolichol-phosphate mannosyltransferase
MSSRPTTVKREPPQPGRAVVIATYNEAANLKNLVPRLAELMPDALIVVVDDSSPDGTPEMLREMGAGLPALVPVIRPGKQGYGSAVTAGLRRAIELGAGQIATMDADFSHDPADVPRLFEALTEADVAVGSRYFGGVRVLNWHPSRLLLSLFANRYVKTILGISVQDATSGFRAYRRQAAEHIVNMRISSLGYSFLVEVLYGAVAAGYEPVEVPIIYAERREGQSKMSKKVIAEAVFRPWQLRAARLFGRSKIRNSTE